MTRLRCPVCDRTIDTLATTAWCMTHPYPHEAKKPAAMVLVPESDDVNGCRHD